MSNQAAAAIFIVRLSIRMGSEGSSLLLPMIDAVARLSTALSGRDAVERPHR